MLNTCVCSARAGVTRYDKGDQTRINFSRKLLAISFNWSSQSFQKKFIGCIPSPDKYQVNRRGIKHFKGRKLRGFYLLQITSVLYALGNNCVTENSLARSTLCQGNCRSATLKLQNYILMLSKRLLSTSSKTFRPWKIRRSGRAVEIKATAFAPARKPYRKKHLFRHKSGGFTRDFCNEAKLRLADI